MWHLVQETKQIFVTSRKNSKKCLLRKLSRKVVNHGRSID